MCKCDDVDCYVVPVAGMKYRFDGNDREVISVDSECEIFTSIYKDTGRVVSGFTFRWLNDRVDNGRIADISFPEYCMANLEDNADTLKGKIVMLNDEIEALKAENNRLNNRLTAVKYYATHD